MQACRQQQDSLHLSDFANHDPAQPVNPSAVLIPFVQRPQGLQILLTQRSEHLRHHPGQISFPGGKIDHEDASAEAAALREMEEELGVPESSLKLLGRLPEYVTGTGFSIAPIAALMEPHPLTINQGEVAEAFEVPADWILLQDNFQNHNVEFNGKLRQFYSLTWQERFIWGATAGILYNFRQQLNEWD
ncbi:CoA pyrophosphatase [Pelagibaculum spongiae]|uniref:CoA pyrophosphatase n=2 Tax=Pelagibaculum spongiae TaxID=2080658 RepID=A0A2V1H3B9_9GAMM|nr:CoA pyrophosphatase [Pelagibaculum spongiae]